MLIRVVVAGCWVAVCKWFLVKKLSSVSWYCVVGNVGGLWGIVQMAENAMLMRGGTCAAELRLMGLGFRSRCAGISVFVWWAFCVVCFLLRRGDFWLYVFLDLRL